MTDPIPAYPSSSRLAIWIDIRQAASRNGFSKGLDIPVAHDGWYLLRSTGTPFQLYVAARSYDGPWFISFTEPRILNETLPGTDYQGQMPGHSGRMVCTLADLGDALARIFHLVTQELPISAYQEFLDETHDMPAKTEAEQTAIIRTAQGIFRKHLDRHWHEACAVTGLKDRALLRASHIKPWAMASAYERLDPYNGLLLSALWDAAFDQGLVSFSDEGSLLLNPKLSERAVIALTERRTIVVPMQDRHAPYLLHHRLRNGFPHN